MSEVVRPAAIQFGLMEREGTDISEMMQSCGRIWALLKLMEYENNFRYAFIPEYLADLKRRREWGWNFVSMQV